MRIIYIPTCGLKKKSRRRLKRRSKCCGTTRDPVMALRPRKTALGPFPIGNQEYTLPWFLQSNLDIPDTKNLYGRDRKIPV